MLSFVSDADRKQGLEKVHVFGACHHDACQRRALFNGPVSNALRALKIACLWRESLSESL